MLSSIIRKLCIVFSYGALICLPSAASANNSGIMDDLINQFDRYFVTQMKKHKVPGAAYVVVHGDEIIKMRPYGVRKQRYSAPVDIHTSFRLASVSKTFAATLAAKQESEGSFNWEDPVIRYFPQLKFSKSGHAKQLTVEHLLNHTSGLVPNAYDNLLEANQPLIKIVPQFKKLDPLCPPGKCYGYQNVIYSMIEQVIEQSNPLSYEQLMQDSVFAPLGMRDASLGREAFVENPNHATGHIKLKRGWLPKAPRQNYYNFPAAAGVNASISDMGQWLLAHLGHRQRVISSDVLKQLRTPHVETKKDMRRKQWRNYLNDAAYGLGWRLYNFKGEDLVYHSGWVAGFRADLAYAPDLDIGIAVLLNAESHAINFVSTRFWDMVTNESDVALLREKERPGSPTVPSAVLLRQSQVQPHNSQAY